MGHRGPMAVLTPDQVLSAQTSAHTEQVPGALLCPAGAEIMGSCYGVSVSFEFSKHDPNDNVSDTPLPQSKDNAAPPGHTGGSARVGSWPPPCQAHGDTGFPNQKGVQVNDPARTPQLNFGCRLLTLDSSDWSQRAAAAAVHEGWALAATAAHGGKRPHTGRRGERWARRSGRDSGEGDRRLQLGEGQEQVSHRRGVFWGEGGGEVPTRGLS